jgi:hypothetical protein
MGQGGCRGGGARGALCARGRGRGAAANAPGCTCLSTLWMYELKVSERLLRRAFLEPVEAVFAAFAVFLEGAALAIWKVCGV